MIGFYGSYDAVVVGAGVTGVIAAIAAARSGARTLLVEAGGFVGGMLTGGRLTRAVGTVEGGIFREAMLRVQQRGAGHAKTGETYWGHYTGVWDPEIMQRVLLEMIDEAQIEVLLHARVVDAIIEQDTLRGIELLVKSGRRIVLSHSIVDASGDADVAYLAGAGCQVGREADGRTQPMSSYVRLLNVDFPAVASYVDANRDDFALVDMPVEPRDRPEDYVFNFTVAGFAPLIAKAREEGFEWILPRERILMKAGQLPGEVNLNVTRVQGNALEERDLSRAEIDVRRQAYCVFDFLKSYVPGFEKSVFLEVAPRLGVRESRRIVGDYVLTEHDVRGHARFDDAIGVCDSPIDIHDPDSSRVIAETINGSYDIPLRCMLPQGLDGMLVAGRCASADHVAAASLRNTPACAMMGEAAGIAVALAAQHQVTVRKVPTETIQMKLKGQCRSRSP